MLNLILQIILGIFIVLIMGFIAYSIFDREYLSSIRLYNTNKKETQIFTGIYPLDLDQARIETLNKNTSLTEISFSGNRFSHSCI